MRTFILLVIIAVLLGAWAFPQMPDRMASHFNASGSADGWMGRTEFFILYGGLIILMAATFAGLALLMPVLPSSMMNLPHRDHWLTPERREGTVRVMRDALYRIGSGTMLFLLFVMADVFRANLTAEPRTTDLFWPALALYLFYVVWESVRLLRRFSRISDRGL